MGILEPACLRPGGGKDEGVGAVGLDGAGADGGGGAGAGDVAHEVVDAGGGQVVAHLLPRSCGRRACPWRPGNDGRQGQEGAAGDVDGGGISRRADAAGGEVGKCNELEFKKTACSQWGRDRIDAMPQGATPRTRLALQATPGVEEETDAATPWAGRVARGATGMRHDVAICTGSAGGRRCALPQTAMRYCICGAEREMGATKRGARRGRWDCSCVAGAQGPSATPAGQPSKFCQRGESSLETRYLHALHRCARGGIAGDPDAALRALSPTL